MTAYYNEIDPYAAQWLRNLIAAGHIAPGDVDERDIRLVRADDLRGYTQCHFFAGIGVWSYALRLAGVEDDEEVWTGSCPCQSFSGAGSRGGFDDERHLWPHWAGLIRERRPSELYGEQVASKDGLAWLDFVCADLEAEGYAVAPFDLCAAGFGAPHIRQRLFFVAHTRHASGRPHGRRGHDLEGLDGIQPHGAETSGEPRDGGEASGMADPECRPAERFRQPLGGAQSGSEGQAHERQRIRPDARYGRPASFFGNAEIDGRERQHLRQEARRPAQRAPLAGFWSEADWIACRDGKTRPIEPGTSPLVAGATCRVGRLRAYGNAIVAPVAAEFIRAYREVR
jgi:DNA (cytosine-5)-methyltransferase 1